MSTQPDPGLPASIDAAIGSDRVIAGLPDAGVDHLRVPALALTGHEVTALNAGTDFTTTATLAEPADPLDVDDPVIDDLGADDLGADDLGADPGFTDAPMAPVVPVDRATASRLVAACEAAWTEIRRHHPDLPDTVVILGSGIEGGRFVKLGHWWSGQWLVDHQARGEVLLAGEALHLPADEVFQILLHEAAHGLAAARGVKDTSRAGRYHNQRYRNIASSLGLRVQRLDPYGWARTSLTPAARNRYGEVIERLADEMTLARTIPRNLNAGLERISHDRGDNGHRRDGDGVLGRSGDDDGRDKAAPRPAAMCGCGRRIQMAPGVLARGPVLCGLCGQEFLTARQRELNQETSSREPTIRNGHGADPTVIGMHETPHEVDSQIPFDLRHLELPGLPADVAATRTSRVQTRDDGHGFEATPW